MDRVGNVGTCMDVPIRMYLYLGRQDEVVGTDDVQQDFPFSELIHAEAR